MIMRAENAAGQPRAVGRELTATATDTNVLELTSRLINQYGPQAVAKGLRLFSLLPDSAPPVRLDPLRFRMVVAHLLDNAVKFTVSGSIKVRLVTHLESCQPTGLIIADTGVGIPADAVESFRCASPWPAPPTRATMERGLAYHSHSSFARRWAAASPSPAKSVRVHALRSDSRTDSGNWRA